MKTAIKKTILTRSQQPVTVEVPPPSEIQSFFVFALYKSGSFMLDQILEEICGDLQIPLISVAKTAFNQGVDEENFGESVCELFTTMGYGYYGSRHLPSYLDTIDLTPYKKILLVRDPRDILVSHYFSMKKSHVIPTGELGTKLARNRELLQNMDVNAYALEKAPVFGSILRRFTCIEDDLFKLFRYEDVVFNKAQWIQDILDFLGLELPAERVEAIAQKYNVFPTQEDPSAHIRQVTPGDFRNKLSDDTIASLNEQLEDVLTHYGYDLDAAPANLS